MNTQKITSEIIATGMTQQQLADLVNCSQATICAFLKGRRGTRPSLAIGTRLLALHKEHCESKATSDAGITDCSPEMASS